MKKNAWPSVTVIDLMRNMRARAAACVVILSMLVGRAHATGNFSWQRVRPLAVSARAGTVITLSGSFNASAAYACQFDSTSPYAIGKKLSTISRPAPDGSTLECVAPEWSFGAQVVRLMVFNVAGASGAEAVDVRGLLPGPGGTADRITYLPAWSSRSVSEGNADGGLTMVISGFGFDVKASDYVCKFVCIHSSCESLATPRFAQSVIPATPLSDKTLRCQTPMWPFTAFSGGDLVNAGSTRVVLEKGGVEVAYLGGAPANRLFIFKDIVTGADKNEGLATANSTLTSVSGFGFDEDAIDYSCVYGNAFPHQDSDNHFAASAATAVTSTTIQCLSPHWQYEATATNLYIYKDACRGSRGTSVDDPCDANARVRNQYQLRFTFVAAVEGLLSDSAPASASPAQSLTVLGGGFSPGASDYSVVFAPLGNADWSDDGGAEVLGGVVVNITGAGVTGSSLQVELPSWGLRPNMAVAVKVRRGNEVLPMASAAALTFTFTAAWLSYQDRAPTGRGSARGGERITISGSGFAVNASHGTDSDYVCKFSLPGMEAALFSDAVVPVSDTKLVCVTPVWGAAYVGTQVQVSVMKGSYMFPQPAEHLSQYTFDPSWYDWSSSLGPVSGGDAIDIIGVGFNTSRLYRCVFDFNGGELVAYSAAVAPTSTTRLACVTPMWKSWRDGSTRLKLLVGAHAGAAGAHPVDEMHEVMQDTVAEKGYRNATYQFVPGFVVSTKSMVLTSRGSVQRFTLATDTEHSGPVNVAISSSDTAVATVASPYTFQGDDGAGEGSSSKDVSVQHLGVGVAYLSIAANGPPYGHTYANYIRVVCKASLLVTGVGGSGSAAGNVSEVTAMVLQKGEVREVSIDTDSNAGGELRFLARVESAEAGGQGEGDHAGAAVATATPRHLTLLRGVSEGRVRVSCLRTGMAALVVQVTGMSGNVSRELYENVSTRVPVRCRPGIVVASGSGGADTVSTSSFGSNFVRLQPREEMSLMVSLDTAPTVRTSVHLTNSKPDLIQIPELLVFPAFSQRVRVLTLRNIAGSSGDAVITLSAESPGMLEQFNDACAAPGASKCAAVFRDMPGGGCDFSGYNNGSHSPCMGVVTCDGRWLETMSQVSALAAGAGDLTQTECATPEYFNCYRSSCCASPEALACSAAVENAGCNVSMMVPELAQDSTPQQDDSTTLEHDFGVAHASAAQREQLYKTWVPGVNCLPHVACAWARCFPGKGNYEGVTSHPLTIRALPGFGMDPPMLSLLQGSDQYFSVLLDRAPSTPVTVALSLISDLTAGGPVALLEPTEVTFVIGQTRSAPVTVRWMTAGRASLRLTTALPLQTEAGEYTNVTQLLPRVFSASPGFVYSSNDDSKLAGFEQGVFPVVYMQVGSNSSVNVAAAFASTEDFVLHVSDSAGLLRSSESQLNFSQSRTPGHMSFTSTKVGTTYLSLQGVPGSPAQNSSGNATQKETMVLSHGTGYTAGTLSLEGYGTLDGSSPNASADVVATYEVGVLAWDYYYDGETLLPRQGAGYSSNHGSAVPGIGDGLKVEVCWRGAVATTQRGPGGNLTIGHSEGVEVVGCAPKMGFAIEAGRIVQITFDNSSCLVTGLTCALSLQGYSGAGFAGFFTTGVTSVSLLGVSEDYVCDWACFLTLQPAGGAGAKQACPVATPTCDTVSGFATPALVMLADMTRVQTSLKVVSVALADIVPDVTVVRQTQTAIVTVTPREIPSGNVSFTVSSDTDAVTVTSFTFVEGGECESHVPMADCLQRNAKTFTVTYSGFGSTSADIAIIGRGVGNYDGFRGQINLRLLPGLDVSPDRVVLQHFPGFARIRFAPDTPPNRETNVRVHVLSDFGSDAALDSYQESIVLVPEVLVMARGQLAPQIFQITHGAVEGNRLRNRVSGKAVVTFSVDDPGNIYHGTGIIGSARSIAIDVLPGFESNVQDTYRREVQRDTQFVLTLTLNEPTTQSINVTAISSRPNAASVATATSAGDIGNGTSVYSQLPAGSRGPLYVMVKHQSQGEANVSIKVTTPGGNYGGVESIDYLRVSLMPGFVTSVSAIKLQYSARSASFFFGLDTPPTRDVEIAITTSDSDIIIATPSLFFDAAQWYDGFMQEVQVLWRSPGVASVTFSASSPGGNYNRASCCSVSVTAYGPMTVSESSVLVQRGGETYVAVSLPSKPASLTTISMSSFPAGVVNVSEPYVILPGTNETQIITISHLARGSATVRIAAASKYPGDTYDGVEYDVHVTAMPGFIFSETLVKLFSCPRSSRCVAVVHFGPEVAPTADVHVTLTVSDTSVVHIEPTSFVFASSDGMAQKNMTMTVLEPGTACLSFAATSRGNYDMVSSGGVTVVSYPDFSVSDLTIYPLNAPEWGPHALAEFDPENPVVYVQSNSYSTLNIAPKTLPSKDSTVTVINPRPDILNVTEHVHFAKQSLSPGVVTVTHLGGEAGAEVRLSLQGEGTWEETNYGGALWNEGILVKVVPEFEILSEADHRVTVLYHFEKNITIRPMRPQAGHCTLHVTAQDPGLVSILTPTVHMRADGPGNFTIGIKHINPGFTRVRIIAVADGPPHSSNYHNAELILVLTLNYPGFDVDTRDCVWGGRLGCSPTVLHVQRWEDKALTGSAATRGTARVYFTPNETPDSQTNINMDSSDESLILVQAEDKVLAQFDNDQILAFRNTWVTGNKNTKFFQATHLGQLGAVTLAFGSPQSDKWPEVTGCQNNQPTCPASNNEPSVYFGVVMPIPMVTVIAHAGFRVSQTLVYVQRQNQVVVQIALDSVPDGDTFVYLTSSDPSIATVTSQTLVLRGESVNASSRNVTIVNQRPGVAYISLKSSSLELDYDGAEADNAIQVQCQQGFQLSSLLLHVQAAPSNGGKGVLTITPDLPPSHNVTMTVSSSNTGQIQVDNPLVVFVAGVINTRNISLSHIASGSSSTPVRLTLALETHVDSNYYFVVAPKVTVVPLGTFVVSSTSVTVQKGRQTAFTIAPNIAPDQDVTVHITVSNMTVVTATPSVILLAGSLAPQVVTVTHQNMGVATLSFEGTSAEGNYNGATLENAVSVDAAQGFQVYRRVPGTAADVMGELVPERQTAYIVQPQPTSHLAQARFLVLSDLPVDRDITISVMSSDPEVVSTFQDVDNTVSIAQGTKGPALVKVQHGGKAGTALISFRVDTPGGNYDGVASGNVQVVAMPVLIFSSTRVDIQTAGVGVFTVRPGTAPSSDCTIQCVSSDPSIATVTPSIVLRAADALSANNTKTVTLEYVKQGAVTVSFFDIVLPVCACVCLYVEGLPHSHAYSCTCICLYALRSPSSPLLGREATSTGWCGWTAWRL